MLFEHTALQQIGLLDWWSYNVKRLADAIDLFSGHYKDQHVSSPEQCSSTTCASASAMKSCYSWGRATDLHLVVNADLWLAV
jgi:hypothetical protein